MSSRDQSTAVAALESQPHEGEPLSFARRTADALREIARDATQSPDAYARDTTVPEGGE